MNTKTLEDGQLRSWSSELVDLLGGPSGSPTRIDWDAVTEILGRPILADFRYLAEVIGPCVIEGDIILTAPGTSNLDLDFVGYYR